MSLSAVLKGAAATRLPRLVARGCPVAVHGARLAGSASLFYAAPA
jgi:hypothetical protein